LGLIVLVAGFLGNAAGLFGAGDAKFAAVMAPFFIGADARFVMGLFAACLLGAFASHRLAARIPTFRAATADWASWTSKDFPMGLALAGTLIFYLLAALMPLF
jgi:prepilin peptidase CpaA